MASPKSYESFDLLIRKTGRRSGEGRRYTVQLLASPAGEAPPSSRHSFSDKNLREALGGSKEIIWRDLRQTVPGREAPEEIGAELFRSLISKEIQRCWDASVAKIRHEGKGLRLRLRLGDAPELEQWPWELLYDPSHRQFLSLAEDIAVVRYLENPTDPSFERIHPPLRVLVVIANPAESHPLGGEQEWALLNQALESLVEKDKVEIERLLPPTLPALEQAMKESWHVVHFVGHGGFANGEGTLLLEDESGRSRKIPGKKLKVVLGSRKQLRLVVLNACGGAQTSPENAFAGVAQSLVGAGLPAVVAMRCRVSDSAALLFADRFYTSLADELAVDVSLGEARRAMHADADDLEWSTPVLHLRSPDGDILKPTISAPPGKQRWPRLIRRLGAALAAATAAGWIYWAATLPDLSTDPDCPSPPGLDMPFVKIKPGRFLMGRNGRQVEITRPFCLGKFEVTQGQWKKVMGGLPSQTKEGDSLPVDHISWNDAEEFNGWLAAKEPAARYDLPTEAQWEYAARAGTSGNFSFDGGLSRLPEYANCSKAGKPIPGGMLKPNPWGLYDMYGNVSEWVRDWDGMLPAEPAVDPIGPMTGTDKIRRGGDFLNGTFCDSLVRHLTDPGRRASGFGFRIVRDPLKSRQLSRPFRPQHVVIPPPRASAFGLSPGLHSPDPLGRTQPNSSRAELPESWCSYSVTSPTGRLPWAGAMPCFRATAPAKPLAAPSLSLPAISLRARAPSSRASANPSSASACPSCASALPFRASAH